MPHEAEMKSTRIVNASVDDVWEMWTNPTHLAKWWGPKGFTNTFHNFEFKENGRWSFTMHGPDGTDYPNEIVYVNINPKTSLVMDHVNAPKFRITATFEPVGNRTRITFSGVFESAAVYDAVKDFVILGNEENFDRIEVLLAEKTGTVAAIPFELSRTFKTDIETMWQLWTSPEHMAKWWGPKGNKVGHVNRDFRRGGTYHYCMILPDGGEMWGKMYYRDIVPQKRLMFVNTFSNAEGGIARHPMSPEWPEELLSLITFESTKDGEVTVTIRWSPINATPEEIKCFNDGHAGMTQGWGGVLDCLESIL